MWCHRVQSMRLAVLLLVFVSVCTASGGREAPDLAASALRVAARTYDECQHSEDGFGMCLKRKAITLIDRFARVDSIVLTEDVKLERAPDAHQMNGDGQTPSSAMDANWEQSLPRSAEGRERVVNEVLLERVAELMGGRTVNVRLPVLDSQDIGRAVEEGRGKMKKMMSMMMMGFMMKMAAMVPVAIALLYALAGKALIISKIALLLAGIIAIKKLISMKGHSSGGGSGGGGGGGGGGGWQSSGGGGGGGGGWDRRSNEAASSHPLAYKAYATAVMQ